MEEMNQMGQPQEPSSGIKKYVITFIILLIIIGGIYWIIRSSIDIGKTLPAAADSSSVQIIINHKDAPADWKQYTNEEYAVEMSYPDIFTQETADIDLPSMKTKIVGTRLVHTVDKENCVDRSDPKTCTPKTEDIAVGLFFLKKNFVDFRNLLLAQTPDARLQGVTFDGHEGFMLAVDKEGKGIYQFFFPNSALAREREYAAEHEVAATVGPRALNRGEVLVLLNNQRLRCLFADALDADNVVRRIAAQPLVVR